MKTTRRTVLIVVFLLLSGSLLTVFSGCSDGGDDDNSAGVPLDDDVVDDDDASPAGDDDTADDDDDDNNDNDNNNDTADDDDNDTADDDDDDDDNDTSDDDDDNNDDDDDVSPCEGCLINEICYANGEPNPANGCQWCNTDLSMTDWSNNDGAVCEDGLYCNGADTCAGGACAAHIGNPCPDNGLWCDGEEFCNEDADACDVRNAPTCPDNGLWCDGEEFCNEDTDACDASGEPCVAPFVCNELTDTCESACYLDYDSDGYGDPNNARPSVSEECPEGWTPDNTDCDDANPIIHPGAMELPDDNVDQDCDGADATRSDEIGVFVAPTGDDGNPGTMAHPRQTIAAGIALAEATGKVVFVAAGDYTENPTTSVSLFGGYEAAGWTRDMVSCITVINSIPVNLKTLIIEGGNPISVQGFTINGRAAGSESTGVYISQETIAQLADNVIDGGAGTSQSRGVNNSGGSMILVNSIIVGGTESSGSIGVSSSGGTAILANNIIEGGSARSTSYGVLTSGTVILLENDIDSGSGTNYSHGVYISNFGNVTLMNNVINGGPGGYNYGVFNYTGTVKLLNNVITTGPGGDNSYGVISQHRCTMTLVNNIIDGGYGSDRSRGVSVFDNSTATLANNVINGGSDGLNSYSIYISISTATLANNVITGGSGDASYGVFSQESTTVLLNNDIWDQNQDYLLYDGWKIINDLTELNLCGWTGCAAASGNINEDPLFVDPLNDDWRLQGDSPCIDTGADPTPYLDPSLVEFDFEGDPRPYGPGWDIGADEWTP